jgi:hypothetical protein
LSSKQQCAKKDEGIICFIIICALIFSSWGFCWNNSYLINRLEGVDYQLFLRPIFLGCLLAESLVFFGVRR